MDFLNKKYKLKDEEMKRDKVLLIIPAFNEEKNILNVYKKCMQKKDAVDVIVINDGSTDNTKTVLEENHIPHVNLVY